MTLLPRYTKGQPGFSVWLPFFILILSGTLRSEELRGVWVVRHHMTSESAVQEVVEVTRDAGLNTLFVQVRGRGDAYYDSDLVPGAEGVAAGFDPLERCIELARDAGLRVHAWINVYLTWHPDREPPEGHLLRRHPEWFMISKDGIDMGQITVTADLVGRGVEGRYLSPANPSVHHHLLEVIDELVSRYPVDGVHLDYVRYPNEHYDFSPLAQSGFWSDSGHNVPESDSPDNVAAAWKRWRSQQVTAFVRSAKLVVETRRKGALLSAAVKPDLLQAYDRYGQNWVHWVNRRYLDFALPMFYTGSTEDIGKRMRQVRKYIQRGSVYAGIGAWNQTTDDTIAQIEVARNARLNGFSLFSFESLLSAPDLRERMKQQASGGSGL